MLRFLSAQSSFTLWMIFLIENLFVTGVALLFGWLILKWNKKPVKAPTKNEVLICILTNCVSTVITYVGFSLWKYGYIVFIYNFNWQIVTDFLILFLAMDFAMYMFHYVIHHSVAYKAIHKFHHNYSDPIPIDLFVLHPLETVGFGLLWILAITALPFNFYAVFVYLVINVIFGITGHLGIEPIPTRIRNTIPFKYLGTSSFHHRHHLEIDYNFGFYTSIWDKLFGTYKS